MVVNKSPLPLFAKEGKFLSKLIVTGSFTFLISIEIKLSAFKNVKVKHRYLTLQRSNPLFCKEGKGRFGSRDLRRNSVKFNHYFCGSAVDGAVFSSCIFIICIAISTLFSTVLRRGSSSGISFNIMPQVMAAIL